MDPKMKAFVESNISNEFGLTIDQVANGCRTYGRFSAWLNGNVSQIKAVLEVIKQNGVSPAWFAAYERTEGYNSKWGWLNHTSVKGNPTQDAIATAQWIVSQSKNMTDNPAWIDYANYKDFVPASVKSEGNAHYKNLPSGTIGRVTIAGTAAATWEVYYPQGLKKEYNGVQDYGAPLTNMIHTIESWGGSITGGSVSDPDPDPDPEEPPDEEYPDDTPGGIDIAGFINELNTLIEKMLKSDVYKVGNSEYYQNSFLVLLKQMENTYKIQPSKTFFDEVKKKFEDFNNSYIPEPNPDDPDPDPDPEPDPEPDPDPPVNTKKFPVRIRNGINFWKRSNWGFGTLQRNMTYGQRSSGAIHYGYDIGGGGVKHTIYSVTDGKVVKANYANGIGNRVTIQNTHDKYFLEYGHLDSYNVKVGDTVKAGQAIAIMGDTGGNYAIHLDIKISTGSQYSDFYSWESTIDPEQYLEIDSDNSTRLSQP